MHSIAVYDRILRPYLGCNPKIIVIGFVGNLNQPKWGHLKDLHHAIQLCEPALILGDPTPVVFGSNQEV